jgi:hypothetical protein
MPKSCLLITAPIMPHSRQYRNTGGRLILPQSCLTVGSTTSQEADLYCPNHASQ